MKKTLRQLANKYHTDKGYKHNYTKFYPRYFEKYKYKDVNLMEIGIDKGASIRMWLEYFPNARVYGIDISVKNKIKNINVNRFFPFEGNQSDTRFLKEVIKNCPSGFDIIIDDGSHRSVDQSKSLAFLFRHLKSGGLYVIEDLNYRGIGNNVPKMVEMIIPLSQGKKFVNQFITEDDCRYIEENTENCELFCKDKKVPNLHKICFIRKK